MLGAEHDTPARAQRARDRERREHTRRGRVLDVPVEVRGQAEELREPVERHLLELLQRRRRAPEDPDLVEPGDQELGEDTGLRCGRREVREEARALPVRQPRQEHVVEVAEHRRERLGLVRRRRRERCANVSGLDLGENGKLAHALEVGRDPLDRSGTVLAKRAHDAARPASDKAHAHRSKLLRSAPTCACSAPAPS